MQVPQTASLITCYCLVFTSKSRIESHDTKAEKADRTPFWSNGRYRELTNIPI